MTKRTVVSLGTEKLGGEPPVGKQNQRNGPGNLPIIGLGGTPSQKSIGGLLPLPSSKFKTFFRLGTVSRMIYELT